MIFGRSALRRWFPRAPSLVDTGRGTGFVLAGIATAQPELELCAADRYEEALDFPSSRHVDGVPPPAAEHRAEGSAVLVGR
jgi:hypothetical protein